MAAVERLRVGAVGERDLDLDEHVAGAGLRVGDVLEPDVARPVEDQRLHGVKTTFSASPRAVELEPLGEALERQHGRLGQVEVGEELDRLAHVARRRRA